MGGYRAQVLELAPEEVGLLVAGKRCSLLPGWSDCGGKQELDNALRLVRLLASKLRKHSESPTIPLLGSVGAL